MDFIGPMPPMNAILRRRSAKGGRMHTDTRTDTNAIQMGLGTGDWRSGIWNFPCTRPYYSTTMRKPTSMTGW